MKVISIFLLLLWCIGLSSCSNLGSTALPPDRLGYNMALGNSENQQSVLNIVRLRYSDSPYFLSINNVVSQLSFSSDITAGISNQAPPPALIGNGSATFNYSENPTITYTPLQGEDFITRLLTPIDLSVVYMLIRSGWSMNHVLRLCVQRFGPIENAVLASRTTSSRIPIFKEFLEVGLVFLHAQHEDNLSIVADKVKDKFAIKVIIKNYKRLNAKERKMLAKFDVSEQSPVMWLVSTPYPKRNKVLVETRTVYGLLNYLSKAVDVPPKDIASNDAPVTYDKNGKMFDWHDVTVGMGRIKSSRFKPKDAYIRIRYRDSWFYVANSDFEEKETLNILAIIIGVYQGKIQSYLPVFTIS